MSEYICPYCNKEVFIDNTKTFYTCNNHKVKVDILEECVFIYNEKFDVAIYKNESMKLYHRGYRFIMSLQFDKSLTPENFEEKLNFYLMFK